MLRTTNSRTIYSELPENPVIKFRLKGIWGGLGLFQVKPENA